MRAEADAVSILIIDDNAESAELMAWWLRTRGQIVETVTDGTAAVDRTAKFKAQCVLLDVLMPGLAGPELVSQLRASHEDVVLIAMSGFGADDHRVGAMLDLVDHYFEKPVDLDALVNLLAVRRTA